MTPVYFSFFSLKNKQKNQAIPLSAPSRGLEHLR